MRFSLLSAALLILTPLTGCGGGGKRAVVKGEKPASPGISFPKLEIEAAIPPASLGEKPVEEPEFIEVEPRAKMTLCWMYDREDGIYAYPDERLQEVELSWPEAHQLGIPREVWFYALTNPETISVFLLQRHRS